MEEENQHINKKRKIENTQFNENNNSKLPTRKLIKMYCPKSAKTAEIMAWEDQRLDLGSIARTFGIEPVTLRLNGHLISRGVDMIASSVTWRSLVSFFSSKGLSTGVGSSGALLVDGKLLKCGTKRGHDPEPEAENGIKCVKQREKNGRMNQNPPHSEVISLPNCKKLKESNNQSKIADCCETGSKRKNWVDNFSSLIKRAKIDGRHSNEFSQGREGREGCITQRCCYDLHDTMKRVREDSVLASTCKRMR